MNIPKLPIAGMVDSGIEILTAKFSFFTRAASDVMENGIDGLYNGLFWLHPLVFIIILTAVAWYLSKKSIAVFTFFGLLLIWNLNLWSPMISTVTLVLLAALVSILFGIPLGVLAAFYKKFERIVMPVLDFMQTMPAFVYLIPAIPFFGLGPVSAVFTTVIFSMPPVIRLTCLGIKQVPEDLIEAADAFGTTRMQKLVKVQFPIAIPTIMAGVNQTIMLALSMVVIAAMIGAGGLGGEVWKAIQRLKPGMGFEAGLAVVIIAIILDRITQKVGKYNK